MFKSKRLSYIFIVAGMASSRVNLVRMELVRYWDRIGWVVMEKLEDNTIMAGNNRGSIIVVEENKIAK
jgi:hypothetical protein